MKEIVVFLSALLLILASYLLGSMPSAYIIGRLVKGIDLRKYGSGNVGGSNVWQVVSRWALLPVGVVDVGKGLVCVLIARWYGFDLSIQVAAGLASIAGHNWSLFLGFTGGRGIGTSLGVMAALAPQELLVFVAVALLGVILWNMPLGIGIGMVLTPVASWVFDEPVPVTLGCLGMVILMIAKRLASNRGTSIASEDWKSMAINRLLFDRDIRDREAWIHRGIQDVDGASEEVEDETPPLELGIKDRKEP